MTRTLESKWVHCGRVNSKKRYKWCESYGADSADGTYVAFGPDINIPKMARWLSPEWQLPLVFDVERS